MQLKEGTVRTQRNGEQERPAFMRIRRFRVTSGMVVSPLPRTALGVCLAPMVLDYLEILV
jgi:hypothetical protein